MQSDRELMQQALEVLTHLQPTALNSFYTIGNRDKVITALRERLAQPEQVPKWQGARFDSVLHEQPEQSPLDRMAENARELGLDYEPVNTIANSEAIPEQISEPVAWCVYCDGQFNLNIFQVQDVADVEKVRLDLEYPGHKREIVPVYTTPQRCPNCASLEAQNTELDAKLAEMEKGEPVAWRDHVEQRLLTWRQSFVNRSGDQLALDDFMDKESLDDLIDYVCDEYTTLPRREWVGLTDEEVDGVKHTFDWASPWTLADFARAIEAKLREKNA